MSITELTKRVKASADARTPAQRRALLQEARILDQSGHYDPRYFSEETVRKDRERTHTIKD